MFCKVRIFLCVVLYRPYSQQLIDRAWTPLMGGRSKAFQSHEMLYHDLEVMAPNTSDVELIGVQSF